MYLAFTTSWTNDEQLLKQHKKTLGTFKPRREESSGMRIYQTTGVQETKSLEQSKGPDPSIRGVHTCTTTGDWQNSEDQPSTSNGRNDSHCATDNDVDLETAEGLARRARGVALARSSAGS